jgi:Protein of unknown function (DUF1501)
MPHEYARTPSANGTFSRRELLARCGNGAGMLGLAAVLASQGHAAAGTTTSSPLAPKPPHFPAKAKRVIHLFMNGGPSHVDTFDPKPSLTKHAGQRPDSTKTFDTPNTGSLMASPFRFQRYGQSGLEISELFPHVARLADDLCVIRSMYTESRLHGTSIWKMLTGHLRPIRPAYGSWLLYGLGTENENLPGFVVLGEGVLLNGPSNWSSRFLPGIYQGCLVTLPKDYKPQEVIPHLRNTQVSAESQRLQLDLLQKLNTWHQEQQGAENAFNARIESLELAFRMQTSAAEAFDVSREPESIQALYGLTGSEGAMVGNGETAPVKRAIFGRNCLLARRLVERGVRVVQIYCAHDRPWDTHGHNDKRTHDLAQVVDKPIAALLTDLKCRGLLDETLVLWGGEFGRTPVAQGGGGREHNPWGFTVWLAGGGIKGGCAYGATDEFGFAAVENRVSVHDLHATMLHLMGLDHEKLTYRYSGRDFRLTDVDGHVVKDILA